MDEPSITTRPEPSEPQSDPSGVGSPRPPAEPSREDLVYDTFFVGAIGGATVAIFFLAVDALAGRLMFTPSMLGEVLFTGADPRSLSEVDLEMVALFSAVHLVAFLLFGAFVAIVSARIGISDDTFKVTSIVFVFMTATFFAGDLTVLRGASEVLGLPQVLLANLATSYAMARFLRRAHAED